VWAIGSAQSRLPSERMVVFKDELVCFEQDVIGCGGGLIA
jgi:hypothetical protein